MNITGKNLIGNTASSKNDKTFESIGGVVNNISAKFFEATFDDIDLAAAKAHDAFKIYRNFSGEKKAGFLEKIASALGDAKDDIIAITMQETNLAQGRLQGEMQRTINQIKLFANLLREGS